MNLALTRKSCVASVWRANTAAGACARMDACLSLRKPESTKAVGAPTGGPLSDGGRCLSCSARLPARQTGSGPAGYPCGQPSCNFFAPIASSRQGRAMLGSLLAFCGTNPFYRDLGPTDVGRRAQQIRRRVMKKPPRLSWLGLMTVLLISLFIPVEATTPGAGSLTSEQSIQQSCGSSEELDGAGWGRCNDINCCGGPPEAECIPAAT